MGGTNCIIFWFCVCVCVTLYFLGILEFLGAIDVGNSFLSEFSSQTKVHSFSFSGCILHDKVLHYGMQAYSTLPYPACGSSLFTLS